MKLHQIVFCFLYNCKERIVSDSNGYNRISFIEKLFTLSLVLKAYLKHPMYTMEVEIRFEIWNNSMHLIEDFSVHSNT